MSNATPKGAFLSEAGKMSKRAPKGAFLSEAGKMRIRVKRCEVCASKLDKDGACTWEGCPKCPEYKAKEQEKPNQKDVNAKS